MHAHGNQTFTVSSICATGEDWEKNQKLLKGNVKYSRYNIFSVEIKTHLSQLSSVQHHPMLGGLCHFTHGEMWYTTLCHWHTETVTQSLILFWECMAFPKAQIGFWCRLRSAMACLHSDPHGMVSISTTQMEWKCTLAIQSYDWLEWFRQLCVMCMCLSVCVCRCLHTAPDLRQSLFTSGNF